MPSLQPTLVGLLSAGLLSTGLAGFPSASQAQAAITGPAPGVICDQAGPTCYDRQGPSVGLTQTYFGSIAANRLTAELRNRPQTNEFRLSNGAVCDLRLASCWSDGWQKAQLAPKLTQQLFGSLPPGQNGSGNGLQGLQAPRAGVVCDPGGQLCYDQSGLSLGLTREYFGAYAEQSALRNLGGQAPPRQFRLSNGSACDGMARTCWSDGWSRQRVNVALSNQLFGGSGGGSGSGGTTRPAQCRMTRWFKSLYNGNCELRETRSNRGRLLEVSLQDGNVYTISRPRSGSYQISDRNGTSWPVQVKDEGRTISFSWSDRVLTVTPQVAPSSGLSLGQLIDSLLGQ
jgi:hypothetical protein